MSQQINLFNPRFQKQKRYLTAPALVLMLGAALFGSLAFAVAARGRVVTLEKEVARLNEQVKAAETRRDTALAQLVPRSKDAAVELQLTQAEAENRALHGVADILEQNRVGNPHGYSEYFQALARGRVSGLWLTGVEIDGAQADIGLRGRALQAELLPGYLNGLARQPVLQGKAFGHVEIARPVLSPQAQAQATPPAAAAAAPAAPAAPPAAVDAPYVEFTLQAAGTRTLGQGGTP
ncbi:MSHA biogenesis protein MshA [[Empedobacter] haloabium]|uniref:MSHA biogenesis protein MshA n=1 Tax=[Empedobacter] haloabium TaxID=592317 RepID=A0ABZ1USZ6_9BURK